MFSPPAAQAGTRPGINFSLSSLFWRLINSIGLNRPVSWYFFEIHTFVWNFPFRAWFVFNIFLDFLVLVSPPMLWELWLYPVGLPIFWNLSLWSRLESFLQVLPGVAIEPFRYTGPEVSERSYYDSALGYNFAPDNTRPIVYFILFMMRIVQNFLLFFLLFEFWNHGLRYARTLPRYFMRNVCLYSLLSYTCWNVYFNSSTIEPQAEWEENDEIDIHHKYTKPKKQHPRDISRRELHLLEKNRKRLARLRRKGIQRVNSRSNDIEPEALSPDDLTHIDDFLPSKGFRNYANYQSDNLVSTLSTMTAFTGNTSTEIIGDYCLTIASYLARLSQCDSWEGAFKMLVVLVLDRVKCSDLTRIISGAVSIQPEAAFDDVSLWKKRVMDFRNNLTSLKDTPAFKLIKQSMIVFIVSGITTHMQMESSKAAQIIFQICGGIDRQKDLSEMNLLTGCLEICEISLGFIECFRKGNSFFNYLLPKTAVQKLAELRSYLIPYKQGDIEKISGMTPSEYYNATQQLVLEMQFILGNQNCSGSLLAMHTANYAAAVKLAVAVQSFNYGTNHRIQPICVIFYGPPMCGKSELMARVHEIVGAANGIKPTQNSIYYMKDGDKFDSGLRNDHKFYTADDIANVPLDNIDPRDTQLGQIIHIVNTVPSPSLQAAIEDKGVIFHAPLSLVGSTNSLGASCHLVTNSIASLERRIIHVEVRVKAEYANEKGGIDRSKVHKINGEDPVVNQLSTYELSVVGQAIKRKNPARFEDSNFWMHAFANTVRDHFDEQRAYIARQNGLSDLKKCPCCGQPENSKLWCICSPEDKEFATKRLDDLGIANEMEATIPAKIIAEAGILDNIMDSHRTQFVLNYISDFSFGIEYTDKLIAYVRGKLPNIFNLSNLVEKTLNVITSYFAFTFLLLLFRGNIRDILRAGLISLLTGLLVFGFHSALFWHSPFYYLTLTLSLFILIYCSYYIIYIWNRSIIISDTHRRISLGVGINPFPVAFGAFVFTIGLLKYFLNLIPKDEILPETIDPHDIKDVEERKKEPDMWLTPYREMLPAPMELKSMTLRQVIDEVRSNMTRVNIWAGQAHSSSVSRGISFFLNSNIVIIPKHVCSKTSYIVTGKRRPSPIGTENHSTYRSIYHDRIDIPDTDYSIFVSSKSLPMKNMLKYFAEDLPKKPTAAVMITIRDNEYIEQDLLWKQAYVGHRDFNAQGSIHKLAKSTVSGDCMSVIISRSRPHHILGFHMGGDKKEKGLGFSLTRNQIVNAMPSRFPPQDLEILHDLGLESGPNDIEPEADHIDDSDGSTILSTVPGDASFDEVNWDLDRVDVEWSDFSSLGLDREWLGLNNEHAKTSETVVELHSPVHERSCVNFLMYDPINNPEMTFLGFDPKFITHPRSRVKESILSPFLKEQGYYNSFGPPPFQSGRDHSKYLQLGTKNIDPLPPKLLEMAGKDYFYGVVDEMRHLDYPRSTRPITLMEALNGVEGDRFIKSMDPKTAAGLGFGKKKSNHVDVTYVDDNDNEVPEGLGRRKLIPHKHLIESVSDIMRDFLSGKYKSMFVRSALKDEPSEGKVRIFGVLSFDFLIAGKMLFAPVVSMLLSMPIFSEMFQGINVLTYDWTEMYSHILAFDPEQVGEGDYSKYDTSISGQLIRMCGTILINLAREIGYDERWLLAQTVYIESLALNAWVFNGAIFIVDGWNPSGNWLTAIIAGMTNALLHRCVFYHTVGKFIPFRRYVHLATLGDDSLFSTILPWFNCVTIQHFLASIGMKYTPSDKTGTVVPFIKAHEATFGKRMWRWEPAYSCFVAPLAIQSLMKSLHNYMESETDPVTIAVGVVDNNLFEFARHGPRVFAKYQRLLISVCESAGIAHMVNNLYSDYDELIHDIFERQFTGERRVQYNGDPAAMECSFLLDEQVL